MAEGGDTKKPGDEVPSGTPQSGENVCEHCRGSGRLEQRPCPWCNGTGRVTTLAGDA